MRSGFSVCAYFTTSAATQQLGCVGKLAACETRPWLRARPGGGAATNRITGARASDNVLHSNAISLGSSRKCAYPLDNCQRQSARACPGWIDPLRRSCLSEPLIPIFPARGVGSPWINSENLPSRARKARRAALRLARCLSSRRKSLDAGHNRRVQNGARFCTGNGFWKTPADCAADYRAPCCTQPSRVPTWQRHALLYRIPRIVIVRIARFKVPKIRPLSRRTARIVDDPDVLTVDGGLHRCRELLERRHRPV